MRINKENIHENKIKGKNTMQITLDDDFNVPDSKADIDTIVKERGNVHVDAVKANADRAEVSGCLDFALLYTGSSENDGRFLPVKMAGSMNFNENMNLSADSDNTYVSCTAKLEDITVKAINSRKISVKAIVTITVVCEEIEDIAVGCEVEEAGEDDQLQILAKNLNYTQLAVNIRDNFRIRENVALASGKPDISELLWEDIDIRSINSRLTDDGISLNGELGIFIMYLPQEDNASVQWYETSVGFEGTLDINGCNADMISYVKYHVMSVSVEIKPDYDGENREIAVEMVLDLEVKAYEEREKSIIADIYSPVKQVRLETNPAQFKKLLIRNNSKCRASDRVKLGDYVNMLQICNCTGTAQIDDVTVEEDGLLVDGAIMVNVFYVTADDNAPMGSIRAAVPFSNKIQVKGGPDMEYSINVTIEQLTAVMTGSNEMEIKGSVSLDAICFEPYEMNVAVECSLESFEESEFLKFPSIIGYIANGEDTIWDIAKKYHTTPASIRSGNHALADRNGDDMKVRRGEKLLLVKAAR